MKSPIQVASSLFLRFLQKNAKNHEKMTIFFLKKSEKKCKNPKSLSVSQELFFPEKPDFSTFSRKMHKKMLKKTSKNSKKTAKNDKKSIFAPIKYA